MGRSARHLGSTIPSTIVLLVSLQIAAKLHHYLHRLSLCASGHERGSDLSKRLYAIEALRWAAGAVLKTEPRLYRIAGYHQLPLPAQALEIYVGRVDEARRRAS